MARDDRGRCVPGEDLTAFAHGELPGERRAAISRHLLGCGRCRDEYAGMRSLLRRLRALDAGGSRLGAPAAAAEAPGALSWRSLVAGGGIAAVFLAAFLVSWAPAGGSRGAGDARRASEAQASEVSLLLAAQRADGSWPADAAFGGSRADEAATAVALLALLPDDPGARYEGVRARAVAQATRWLLARRRSGGATDATPERTRNEVVAVAALVEVLAETGDPALRRELEPSLRNVQRAAEALATDPWAVGWLRRALRRARDAGWREAEAALARLEARFGASGDDPRWSAVADGASPGATTPTAAAVRVLARRAY
jgi:hypothetical protein